MTSIAPNKSGRHFPPDVILWGVRWYGSIPFLQIYAPGKIIIGHIRNKYFTYDPQIWHLEVLVVTPKTSS